MEEVSGTTLSRHPRISRGFLRCPLKLALCLKCTSTLILTDVMVVSEIIIRRNVYFKSRRRPF